MCAASMLSVQVSGHKGKLVGVLVELPTLVESYKSLDGDLLFKSGKWTTRLVAFVPRPSEKKRRITRKRASQVPHVYLQRYNS